VHQYTETDTIQLAHNNLVSELIIAPSIRLSDEGFEFSATNAKLDHALVHLAMSTLTVMIQPTGRVGQLMEKDIVLVIL
jgi:hypothetical protein